MACEGTGDIDLVVKSASCLENPISLPSTHMMAYNPGKMMGGPGIVRTCTIILLTGTKKPGEAFL